jgi:hypothetical protein
LHEVIDAIQAVIEAASTSTATLTAYWKYQSREHPPSDEIREAALEMLADALEDDDGDEQRRPH